MPRPAPSNLLSRISTRLGFRSDWYMIVIGAFVGTLTGATAVAFATVLHRLEHLARGLQGGDGVSHGAFGSAEWVVVWLFLGPVIGMGLTGVLVRWLAPDATGHGVPQVIAALVQRGGKMPLRVGVVKALASILTISGGGSSGAEGPIVQIGSVAGSQVGQWIKLDRQALQTLVGCGAAAGMSSIFNAPIAGVFFVLEVLLRDFSLKIFTPIVVASVFSQVTTQALLGRNEAIFATDGLLHGYTFTPLELPSYVALGLVCGLVAIGFGKLLHWGEDLAAKAPLHPLLRPVTGAVLLGALGVGFLALSRAMGWGFAGAPAFFGDGYSTIRTLLQPATYGGAVEAAAAAAADMPTAPVSVAVVALAVLLLFKSAATVVTLASGGSGGVFAPTLFLGATTGALLGISLERLGLIPAGSTPAGYALVGMAATLAASSHAPLTAMLMLFELTRDIYVVLPIMLSAVIATVTAQVLERGSIYTYRLRKSGVLLGEARDATLLRRLTAGDVEPVALPTEPVYPSDPLAKLISLHATFHVPDFVVVDASGNYLGMVTGADVRTALIDREAIPLLLVAELSRGDIPTVREDDLMDSVMTKFARYDITALCVVEPPSEQCPAGRPKWLLTRRNALAAYQRALEAAAS